MRWLVWVVGAAAALYAGLWFVAERTVETRARGALGELEARGWSVGYASLNTTGFPSRLDTRATELRLASPDGSLAWAAPWVQAYALVYRPTHVIVDLPPEQALTLGGTELDLRSEGLRASARAGLSADLPFREAVAESGPLTLSGAMGEVTLGSLVAGAREAGPAANAYDLFLEAEDVAAGAPEGAGTIQLDLVRLDAQVALDAALDRRLAGAPLPTALTLRDLRLALGDMALSASGALVPNAEGVLEGEVVVVAEGWRGMLDLAKQAGVLDADRRTLFEGALGGLAQGEDRIEVPVTFAEGQVSALGLPLLAAPRLPQRQ